MTEGYILPCPCGTAPSMPALDYPLAVDLDRKWSCRFCGAPMPVRPSTITGGRSVADLKQEVKTYQDCGGGWGGTSRNPFNAMIFDDRTPEERKVKQGPRW